MGKFTNIRNRKSHRQIE